MATKARANPGEIGTIKWRIGSQAAHIRNNRWFDLHSNFGVCSGMSRGDLVVREARTAWPFQRFLVGRIGRFCTHLGLVFGSILLSLGALECGLRVTGVVPLSDVYHFPTCPGPDIWCERRYDPVLTWLPEPGVVFADSEQRPLTILNDRTRRIDAPQPASPTGNDMALFGCSVTVGWGVRDDEHFGAILSKAFPDRRVTDYAVEGYGTLQSMLRLRELPDEKLKGVSTVIYGFIGHHLERNVGSYAWNREFSEKLGTVVDLPHAELGPAREIIIVPLRTYNFFSTGLIGHSALSPLIAGAWARWQHKGRHLHRQEITIKLMTEMRHIAEHRGLRFIVAVLDLYNLNSGLDTDKDAFFGALRTAHVETADVHLNWDDAYKLKNGLHPNEVAHRFWGEQLASYLRSDSLQGTKMKM
jgi:hypothetical protein